MTRFVPTLSTPIANATRRRSLLVTGCVLLLLACSAVSAAACVVPIRNVGPVQRSEANLREPSSRSVPAARWGLTSEWQHADVTLHQYVQVRRVGGLYGVSHSGLRTLRLLAVPQGAVGHRWVQDPAPGAPTCPHVGTLEWEAPTIRFVESRREIRVLAVSRQSDHSDVGCQLDDEVMPCPATTMKVLTLRQPIGARHVVIEQLAP